MISIGSMGLIKGVETFKIEKNIKLATYASRCIENEILMYLRKTYKMRQEISLDEILNVDSEGNEMVLADILASVDPETLETLTKDEDRKEIYQALENLPKRERDIIVMRFGLFGHEPLTQKEVADILGISQSYISRLEKESLTKCAMKSKAGRRFDRSFCFSMHKTKNPPPYNRRWIFACGIALKLPESTLPS